MDTAVSQLNKHTTFDPATKLYTVWDETAAYIVCITPYPKVAESALDIYAQVYLAPEPQEKTDGSL